MSQTSRQEPGRAAAGRLAGNVMHFCRVLRAAGLPVGPGKVIDALGAVERVGIARRDDFYWALHASLVDRHDQHALFDQAFHAFWRSADLLDRLDALAIPELRRLDQPPPAARRVAEALHGGRGGDRERAFEVDAALTASAREVLQKIDFEHMTVAEVALAKRAIAGMSLALKPVATRRYARHARGDRIDLRRSLRAALRGGGEIIPLVRRRRVVRPPPIVVLCDISGSMGRYTRMLLHFLHALENGRERVHAFVFGTRLTNITRQLRHKDADVALDAVAAAVEDWSGGTRIGDCVHDFNLAWSRRVLGRGAVVLLISDGLDRAGGERLGHEMERLHKSCRRLIWLNPLLRYDGFEAKALGVRAMLPHVDEFRPVHNLESLAALAQALSEPEARAAA
jgi:uncharacterized protein with von Willebrand factor type A (vWA) domain